MEQEEEIYLHLHCIIACTCMHILRAGENLCHLNRQSHNSLIGMCNNLFSKTGADSLLQHL